MAAPLIPKIRGANDTSQFAEYEENPNVFRIASNPVYTKEFADF